METSELFSFIRESFKSYGTGEMQTDSGLIRRMCEDMECMLSAILDCSALGNVPRLVSYLCKVISEEGTPERTKDELGECCELLATLSTNWERMGLYSHVFGDVARIL